MTDPDTGLDLAAARSSVDQKADPGWTERYGDAAWAAARVVLGLIPADSESET